MGTRYYIEHDGRVRVVERDGSIDLPTEDELDVPYTESNRFDLADHTVVFGNAKLDEHPGDWPIKDDLAVDANATILLRAAVNATLFRPVVGVVVLSGDEVLLVQPARGVARGHWTLPGGFVNAFEDPADAARREVREETGLQLGELRLVGTVTYQHPGSPYPILGLAYVTETDERTLDLRDEEIARAHWFHVAKATDEMGGFAASVLRRLAEEGLL